MMTNLTAHKITHIQGDYSDRVDSQSFATGPYTNQGRMLLKKIRVKKKRKKSIVLVVKKLLVFCLFSSLKKFCPYTTLNIEHRVTVLNSDRTDGSESGSK